MQEQRSSLTPRVAIGSKFAPGTVVRNTTDGTYYECMPSELGTEAEQIQLALLAPEPEISRTGRFIRWMCESVGVIMGSATNWEYHGTRTHL